MWGSRSITSTCVRIARNANACTRNTRAVNACAVRAYSSFGSYENPPNYETGEMDSQQPKKEKRPRINNQIFTNINTLISYCY